MTNALRVAKRYFKSQNLKDKNPLVINDVIKLYPG